MATGSAQVYYNFFFFNFFRKLLIHGLVLRNICRIDNLPEEAEGIENEGDDNSNDGV